MRPEEIRWDGASGKEYPYTIHPVWDPVEPGPGNFVFAKVGAAGALKPLYSGETNDLSGLVTDQRNLAVLQRAGVTHITIHRGGRTQAERREEEADIRAKWQTTDRPTAAQN